MLICSTSGGVGITSATGNVIIYLVPRRCWWALRSVDIALPADTVAEAAHVQRAGGALETSS
ncbi:hypothetical protein K491DRAFT_624134 [Lophiostoma macrostomum CBS 122681]|uniref:Uncharacterized protein n=1 Tax=Lophiostoma macrostomum CBS 122681 TaxID=1314788 RepID=A0A6A6THT5_9PLEO|nr:hypothetical protein K491DRAFT_624134 [Lophiostoma macrostomum CBS 122681]